MARLQILNRKRNVFQLQKLNNKTIDARLLDEQFQVFYNYLNNELITYINDILDEKKNKIASTNPQDRDTFLVDDTNEERTNFKLSKIKDENFIFNSINFADTFIKSTEPSVAIIDKQGIVQWLSLKEGELLFYDITNGLMAKKIDDTFIAPNVINGDKFAINSIGLEKFNKNTFNVHILPNSIANMHFKINAITNNKIMDNSVKNIGNFLQSTSRPFVFYLFPNILPNNIINNASFFYTNKQPNIPYIYANTPKDMEQMDISLGIPFVNKNLSNDFLLSKEHFGYVEHPINREHQEYKFIFDQYCIKQRSIEGNILQAGILPSTVLYYISYSTFTKQSTYNTSVGFEVLENEAINIKNMQPKFQQLVYQAGARWE